ncbi:hypothetical protein T190_00660 [Sinorhizobium meliloti CCBAU 01290]|nr:hypothetical protein T190_00660 [Sinorhizobium meliloti CCBAU 01290]
MDLQADVGVRWLAPVRIGVREVGDLLAIEEDGETVAVDADFIVVPLTGWFCGFE